MNRETAIKYIGVENKLYLILITLFGWSMEQKEDGMMLITDEDDNEINWEDYESLAISPIIYEDITIDAVLLWGDGTIEFHDAVTEDALNFADFPLEICEKVMLALNDILLKR